MYAVLIREHNDFCLHGMWFSYFEFLVTSFLFSPSLDAGYTLKLGNGALMSDIYLECYHVVYGAQRPVRWSVLETL